MEFQMEGSDDGQTVSFSGSQESGTNEGAMIRGEPCPMNGQNFQETMGHLSSHFSACSACSQVTSLGLHTAPLSNPVTVLDICGPRSFPPGVAIPLDCSTRSSRDQALFPHLSQSPSSLPLAHQEPIPMSLISLADVIH